MVRGIAPKKKILSKNPKRTHSQTQWLRRQINDPYAQAAKDQGLRCRASFKIQEIDAKYHVFKNGQAVFDLGAAPGGWSEYVAPKNTAGKTVAIDLLEIDPIQNVLFKQGDFTSPEMKQWLADQIGQADVIMSDIAPNTTGVQSADHLRLMVILDEIVTFAEDHLKVGGTLIAKTFRGGTDQELLLRLKKLFKTVKHFKPESSRKDSVEMFVVAMGFKGNS
ncbi:MAG: RlmE family RNA methyltransferase [Alphaproteobacteria bacterium]|nr:RlmE family RNA methyltransferase [Alphaproteobacteria bacterium]